ncbi:MAG: aspartyl/asparaginyl beta-hydroxylase domain-containing protein, partial [Lysobacter sp.]|nr:aspartyl/asparaginyl beta-hydroxylase domain-containing protein [Lysobacter sp.]
LYLWQDGQPVEEHIAHCPRTYEAIIQLDVPHITTRAPAILFSRLHPGARIPPHSGMLNTRLICHLPLIVPPGCGFRVGGEARQRKQGELLVFDDTVEHEAWNEGSSDRIILIFDIWRPELTARERRAVTALFEAVDRYGR